MKYKNTLVRYKSSLSHFAISYPDRNIVEALVYSFYAVVVFWGYLT